MTNCFVSDILQLAIVHMSTWHCFKSSVLQHFRRNYLKANKVSKSEGTKKLNMHIIIFKTVLMLFTKNYQNQAMQVETTACQSWRVF